MRTAKRFDKRGFTLVELMIVVAIVGVLGALAYVGYQKFFLSSKTAEAKDKVGAIAQAGVSAYERESYANEMIQDGQNSATAMHVLCKTAQLVPVNGPPKNAKYQPNTAAGQDFSSGDATTGWTCLKFQISQPIYFQYGYVTGTGTGLSGATAAGFEAQAFGDLNGDGKNSTFARGADVTASGQVKLSSTIFTKDETE